MKAQKTAYPEATLISFKSYLTDRCGLFFKDSDTRSLEDAISERISSCGLESPDEYFGRLTASSRSEDEFRELLNLLTVGHTYFLRNRPHFHALRKNVLTDIISRKEMRGWHDTLERKQLRIWSAGCSTGEEPYSIAMTIVDEIDNLEEWDVQILATDVSTSAIERARAGVYSANSVRRLDKELLERHFIKVPGRKDRYAISDSLGKMVRFDFLNLRDAYFPGGFDVIFCRNVFIYFQLETTLEIVNKFYTSLLNDGFLFVGHSESLQFLTNKFKMEIKDGGIYYRKATRDFELGVETLDVVKPDDVEKVLEELSKEEFKAERKLKERETATKEEPADEKIVEIIKLIHLKRYDKALSLIEECRRTAEDVVELDHMTAEIYTNRGELEEASSILMKIVESNPFHAPSYLLLGSICLEREDLDEAREQLKKALYLDADFPMARFMLGLVYKLAAREEDAIREFRNTSRGLDFYSPEDVVAYSGGFNAATLAGMCRDNIERLSLEL